MPSIIRSIPLCCILIIALCCTNRLHAQCCSNGVNLLNGYNTDFSAPFTTVPPGFTTDNTYSASAGPGNYTIITSRNYGACSATPQFDHTTGNNTGRYLWFDTPGSATAAAPATAWEPFNSANPPGTQNLITVTQNTVYVFSVWIRDLARTPDCIGGGAPLMGLRINGVDMAQIDLGLTTSPCCPQWTYLCAEWNSGSANTALIQIESRRGNGFTDLGIDDVYFGTTSANFNGILGNDTNICAGNSLLLQPNLPGATAMVWSDGSTGSSLTVTAAGTYWFQATQNGCTGRDTIVVTQGAAPAVNLGADENVCAASYTIVPTVTGSGPFSYLWQNGTTASTLVANASNIYWLQVSNACGTVRDSIVLVFSSPPQAFSLGNDTTLCAGNMLTLQYQPSPGETLLWQDASTSNSYSVAAAGVYYLQVSNVCGSVSDTIAISYNAATPAFSLGNDTLICAGTSIVLVPIPAVAGVYQWQDGSNGSSLTVSAAGVYTLRITGSCGTAADTVVVTERLLPSVALGNDTVACTTTLQLAASTANALSYLWSTGATSASIAATMSDTYGLTVTNQCGNASDDIMVTLFNSPIAPFNNAVIDTCLGVAIQLDAQNVGMSYVWSTNDTTQIITAPVAGAYQVTVTNGACVVTDKVTVTQHSCSTCKMQIPTAFSPNGDKINDLFKPITTCSVNFYEFRIYNRWGELVFSTNDALQGWNGVYKGMEQPLGTYVYYAETQFVNETVKQAQQGNVTLVR